MYTSVFGPLKNNEEEHCRIHEFSVLGQELIESVKSLPNAAQVSATPLSYLSLL